MLESKVAEISTDDDGRASHDAEPGPSRQCSNVVRCARKPRSANDARRTAFGRPHRRRPSR